jgi:Mrp family chromosome partitioning ATPase
VASTARIRALGRSTHPARDLPGDSVKTSGIEELKSALRRSALLIVGVVLFGVLVMNVVRQLGGPEYQAGARVLLNSTDLSTTLLGISPPYQDPTRQDQAEQNLANSPQLYSYAARRAGGEAGTGSELKSKTSVSVSNNVVDFTATTSDPEGSLRAVNAVATAYPYWRAQVSGRSVDTAIAQVQTEIARVGKTSELEKQLQQLQVMKTLNSADTLFVEQAQSATKTTPKPVKDSLLGGAIGLVIALLIVGARELFDTTVRSEGDVEDALEVPVLATIESLPRRMRDSVLDASGGRFADEYELLAANIAQIFGDHEGTVQLAVTSALPGEGKTTTAANLAAALARRGAGVLLADFDLRKPTVSEFVGIPRGAAGVAELLAGVVSLRSALWRVSLNGEASTPESGHAAELVAARGKVVRQSAEGSLTVLPGGAALRQGAAPRFARLPRLLETLPPDADFVVIDTPPALLVAGMAELAQSVDGVIVVVRQGAVSRRRLRALGHHARSWRARLLGAVLNDSPLDEGYHLNYYGRP